MNNLIIQAQTAEEANTLITGSSSGHDADGTHFPAIALANNNELITTNWVKTFHMFVEQPELIESLSVTGFWAIPIEYIDSTRYDYLTQDSDTVTGKRELIVFLQPGRTRDLLDYCDANSGNDNIMLIWMVEQINTSSIISQSGFVIIQRWIVSELCACLISNLSDEESHNAWRTVTRLNDIDSGSGDMDLVETFSISNNNAILHLKSLADYVASWLVVLDDDYFFTLPEWTILNGIITMIGDLKQAITDNNEVLKADMNHSVFYDIVDPIVAPDYSVTITGETAIDSVLTADVTLVRGATGTPTYQWLVNDANIDDATESEFTLAGSVVSLTDKVTVTVSGVFRRESELDAKTSDAIAVA